MGMCVGGVREGGVDRLTSPTLFPQTRYILRIHNGKHEIHPKAARRQGGYTEQHRCIIAGMIRHKNFGFLPTRRFPASSSDTLTPIRVPQSTTHAASDTQT